MKKLKDIKEWKIEALRKNMMFGLSGADISRSLGVPERTVQDNLKKLQERYSREEILEHLKKAEIKCEVGTINGVKVLFGDIETSLAVSYHFGQWNQNLGIKQQVHESHLLSHAWAFGDDEVQGSILTREEVLERNDERLVLEIWNLLDSCDVYVAHNGVKFDVKKMNGYFLKYGLPPPSPYKVYDTLQVSRKKFGLPFHNLAYLAKFLDVTRKIDNSGIELWIGCAQGVQEDLDEMLEYNIGDIVTLREIYYKLIGWDNFAVNMSLYKEVDGLQCPHCASTSISQLERKYAYTAQRKYQVYRCNDCNATLRGGTQSGDDVKLYRII